MSAPDLSPTLDRCVPGRHESHLPGLGLCVAVTAAAVGFEAVETHLFRFALGSKPWCWRSSSGARSAPPPGPVAAFLSRHRLRGQDRAGDRAVVMLGASLSLATILAAGPGLPLRHRGRRRGRDPVELRHRPGARTAFAHGDPRRCGNSICGNSAIAATAPVIGADGEDVAASIAFTAVLGCWWCSACRCWCRCSACRRCSTACSPASRLRRAAGPRRHRAGSRRSASR